jgi:hypothetical protein
MKLTTHWSHTSVRSFTQVSQSMVNVCPIVRLLRSFGFVLVCSLPARISPGCITRSHRPVPQAAPAIPRALHPAWFRDEAHTLLTVC